MKQTTSIVLLLLMAGAVHAQTLQSVTDNGNNTTTNPIIVQGNEAARSFSLKNNQGILRWGIGLANDDGNTLMIHQYSATGVYSASPLTINGSLVKIPGRLVMGASTDDGVSAIQLNGVVLADKFRLNTITTPGPGGGVFAPASATVGIYTSNGERLRIDGNGNVGIGTKKTDVYRLAVEGTIAARKMKVTQEAWPDYVFEDHYKLPSLQETAAFIKVNRHLPDIPSASEIAANGLDLGEMNKKLLQKIEELTLHLIRLEAEVEKLKNK
ncbi:hypothetical protein [Chitinophaga defluvii]|uniref:Endosialidase-like protein n=1 Tax=Chitinophaga defluvii TaxID=3163343 RepID=A0ABV2TER6_9BACT